MCHNDTIVTHHHNEAAASDIEMLRGVLPYLHIIACSIDPS